jgi:uncharacterized membrane-anchored protein YhcB (DUF1043 family)
MPPIEPDALLTLVAVAERLPWLFGLVVLALYHKPILAALQRTTRDPMIEALQEQNRHFAANNKLFLDLGPALQKIIQHTAETAEGTEAVKQQLIELLRVQREIEKQMIRAGVSK